MRIADAESAALLRPGDVVDVLAADGDGGTTEARLVASGVRVLVVPRAAQYRLGAGLGDGALLLVATTLADRGAAGRGRGHRPAVGRDPRRSDTRIRRSARVSDRPVKHPPAPGRQT